MINFSWPIWYTHFVLREKFSLTLLHKFIQACLACEIPYKFVDCSCIMFRVPKINKLTSYPYNWDKFVVKLIRLKKRTINKDSKLNFVKHVKNSKNYKDLKSKVTSSLWVFYSLWLLLQILNMWINWNSFLFYIMSST